jgi:hypothetical protein
MSIATNYLESVLKEFHSYKGLGDKTFAQLNEEQMHFQPNEECNSIAINIQHMHGNMLSRWINFLEEDGEKEWRQRDAEFEIKNLSREQLITLWEEGWKVVFSALEPITKEDLKKIISIRSKSLTVVEAINRQLAHYSYHVGQIVLLGKCVKGKEWQTLSVPRGRSLQFIK